MALKYSIQEQIRRKIQIPLSLEAKLKPDDELALTVEVCRDLHVPKDVVVRSKIGKKILNVITTKKNLDVLERDPLVKSATVRPMQVIQSKESRKARKK